MFFFFFFFCSKEPVLADPISISLAMKAAHRSNVPEGQLAYGFKKRPIEPRKICKLRPNIPEEKLFDMGAKIIEYRKPKASEEESEFDLENEDDDEFEKSCDRKRHFPKPLHSLTYSELGYDETSGRDPKFVNVPIKKPPPTSEDAVYVDSHYGAVVNDDAVDEAYYLPREYCSFAEHLPQHYETMTR